MSNISVGDNTDAGAVSFGGTQAASAQFQVGSIGFGPMWGTEDSMAESIVRISRELEEAQAQIAIYEAERSILLRERDNWREVAQIAVAARDRNKAMWDKCAAELAAVLNGFDDMDAADAEAESMEAAE